MKQAKSIQKTFDKVKGKMTQSQMNKASASLSKATAGVKDLNKRQNASRVERAIPATDIGTTSPVIPPKPQVPDTGDMLGMNNASVLQEGLTLDGGQFVKDPQDSEQMSAAKEYNANIGNVASSILGYIKPEANQAQNAYEDTYGITSRQAGREYRRAQQEVQQYTSQLNTITSNRDASILALEDTGRGQTTGFIGGEQARIQRQAAIAALPVQAQLAAAQGNLEIAKSHVDSLFQMKIKDIETEQAYKQTVANTWMSVANTQQSNLLNAAIADSNARAAEKSQALALANQWAQTAYDNGQSTLAAKMMKLDPTSKTFQQDLSALQGQIVNTQLQMQQQSMRSQMYTESLQQQKLLAELNPTGDGGATGAPDAVQKTLNQISFLQNTITDAKNLVDATGPNLITKGLGNVFVGNTRVKQLANKLDTLKTNLLTLNSDPALKKFFGPQMTEKDTQLLMSAGSTLNAYDASEADNTAELKRYEELLNRMQTAISNGASGTGIELTGGDGLQYIIID